MKPTYLLFILFFCFQNSFAQQAVIIPHLEENDGIIIQNKNSIEAVNPVVRTIDTDWLLTVHTTQTATMHDVPDPALLAQIKSQKNNAKLQALAVPGKLNRQAPAAVDNPIVLSTFDANLSIHNSPPDNTMAISNEGIIVSAINSQIAYYSTDGKKLFSKSFYDFLGNPELTGKLYDPNLLFDPLYQRFIFVLLHGSSSENSTLLLAFSKTSDPRDGWNFYEMPFKTINPSVYVNKWMDFPRIGISTYELFVTVNIFYNNDGGFYKPLLFQLNKFDGYENKPIRRKIWNDLKTGDGNQPFAMVPVTYGHNGNIGPGIYLISTENSGAQKIHLYEINDQMINNPYMVSKTFTVDPYEIPGDALQKNSPSGYDPGMINTGDCRIMNAFYYNDRIHFVFNGDAGSGYSGIFYYRLNVKNEQIEKTIISRQGVDLAYPSVVSASAEGSYQHDVLIAYLSSHKDGYPGFNVIRVDNDMNISEEKNIATGDDYVDILNGEERWGDYSCLQRKYNTSAPLIWASGCKATTYRDFSTMPATIISNIYSTVITELADNKTNSEKESPGITKEIRIFPNPMLADMFSVEIMLAERKNLEFAIFDLSGKKIKTLYQEYVPAGKTTLQFNKGALPAGQYLLTIHEQNKLITSESFIVTH